MAILKVNANDAKSLFDQFVPVYEVLVNAEIEGGFNPETVLDFSASKFLCPLTLLPLASIVSEVGCKVLQPHATNVKAYLDTISFPHGVSSVNQLSGTSYIPLGKISVADPQAAETLTSAFNDLVLKAVGSLPTGGQNAILYPIGEITTNALEHSKHPQGWIFGQYYSKQGHLDICIVDRGRGFSRSYKEEMGLNLDPQDAMQQALKGLSSKKTKERGFGLWTTKRLITDGLGGQCFILSDGAGYAASKNNETAFSLKVPWQGTIVAFRIPKMKAAFDITPFYE